jgi:hypothetical protein
MIVAENSAEETKSLLIIRFFSSLLVSFRFVLLFFSFDAHSSIMWLKQKKKVR